MGLKICLPLAGAGEIRRNVDLVVWCRRRRCRKVPEHYRLCDECESVTVQLHETYRLPSGTLFAAGQGWEPPSTADYQHSYFAGRPRVCRGPPGRPLPRTSMDVYNTGQSLRPHSITCCVVSTSVPKRPATLATTAGVEWSRIAKVNVLSRIWIISTYT